MLEGFATKDLKNQLLSGPSEAEPDVRPASPAESRATRLIASLCGPHLRRRLQLPQQAPSRPTQPQDNNANASA